MTCRASLRIPREMRAELYAEADRLEVSVSWVVRRACKTARRQIEAACEAYERALAEAREAHP